MEKYDQPYRPPPRRPAPPLVWPRWLVQVDGALPEIEKGADHVGLKILKAMYITNGDRNAVQAFYAALLIANGFPIRSQSPPSWPLGQKAWIEAADHAIGEGPRTDIRIEIAPDADGMDKVDLRLTPRQ